MKKRLVTLVFTCILCMSALVLPTTTASAYADVPKEHWAYNAIETLTDAGIIAGVGKGNFAPSDTLTRAQMTKLLVCAVDEFQPNIERTTLYIDVPKNTWYSPYISNGVVMGLYDEYNSFFYPDADLKRGDCALWIARALKLDSTTPSVYWDIADAETANAAATLSEIGIFTGYEDGSFRPDNSLTRAEAAVLITRVRNLLGK